MRSSWACFTPSSAGHDLGDPLGGASSGDRFGAALVRGQALRRAGTRCYRREMAGSVSTFRWVPGHYFGSLDTGCARDGFHAPLPNTVVACRLSLAPSGPSGSAPSFPFRAATFSRLGMFLRPLEGLCKLNLLGFLVQLSHLIPPTPLSPLFSKSLLDLFPPSTSLSSFLPPPQQQHYPSAGRVLSRNLIHTLFVPASTAAIFLASTE
jgi:hypothetical protein